MAARFAAGPFYDVGDALGEGAFGVVVRARSRKHHCECGLKIIAQAKYDEREVRRTSARLRSQSFASCLSIVRFETVRTLARLLKGFSEKNKLRNIMLVS